MISKTLIGQRIRQALDACGLRPTDLAAMAHVSRPAVSSWLKGENLSCTSLVTISQTLQVSLNWLALGIGNMNAPSDGHLTQREQDLIKLIRYFGSTTIDSIFSMIQTMDSHSAPLMKQFKAHDLVSRTQMPICILNAKGILTFSNIYQNRLMGVEIHTSNPMLNKHYTEWIPKPYHRIFRDMLQQTLKRGYASYTRLRMTCPITQQDRLTIIHGRAISTSSGPSIQLLTRIIDNE